MNRFFKDSLALIKNYKWNSLFFRYFRALIFVIIIPAIIFILILLHYYVTLTNNDITTAQRYDIIKSVIQFDKAYDAIDTTYENIIGSELTEALLLNFQSDPEFNREYSKFLTREKNPNSFINSISVYDAETGYVTSSYGSSPVASFRDTSWLKPYTHGSAEFSIPAKPKGVSSSPMYNICRSLTSNGKNRGLIIFTVDGELLVNQMYAGESGVYEGVMIFDGEDNLVYASIPEAYEAAQNDIPGLLEETTYRKDSVLKNSSYLYNSIASENHQFKIISALSMAEYNKNYFKLSYVTFFYFLITLILVIIFSLIIAFTFYRSIVDIVIKISAISDEMGVSATDENNELMYLSDTLLNTVKNHQQIENELVDKISKLKKVQSIALQTQINPHFLFNSLNLVNGFILEECKGESKAATILSDLSDILYIALNTKEYIVTVETELEYAKKYLAIEQIKYPNKFLVKYNLDPETFDCKTVKFVLQPIIENAIEHGIKRLSGKKGIIRISSAIINNKLVLSVSDNGPKIPEDTLAELERRFESDEIQETKHIGLSNVNQRIKLIFGNEYGVSIFSDDYETIIDAVMPVI